jgi:hypothetical protein
MRLAHKRHSQKQCGKYAPFLLALFFSPFLSLPLWQQNAKEALEYGLRGRNFLLERGSSQELYGPCEKKQRIGSEKARKWGAAIKKAARRRPFYWRKI